MRLSIYFLIAFSFIFHLSRAQDSIRFSGVVLDNESLDPLENVAISVKGSVNSAFSSTTGFFSLFAAAGDTIEFNDIRYEDDYFIVPLILEKKDYGIVQLLTKDTQILDEIVIYSFPDFDLFKQAFSNYKPKENLEDKGFEAKRDIMQDIKNAYNNDRFYYQMWSNRRLYEFSGEVAPNNFLNPIAWSNFINDYKDYMKNKKGR